MAIGAKKLEAFATKPDDSWRAEYEARLAEQERRRQVSKRNAAFTALSKRGAAQIEKAKALSDKATNATVRDPALETELFKHWKSMNDWGDSHSKISGPGGSAIGGEHHPARRALEAAAAAYGQRFPESQNVGKGAPKAPRKQRAVAALAAAPAARGAVQTGEHGGRYITLKSGRKFYIGSNG